MDLGAFSTEREKGFEGGDVSGSSPIVDRNPVEPQKSESVAPDPEGASPEGAVTLSHDPVELALTSALDAWKHNGGRKVLRRALLDLLQRLENEA
jgi:hypothetical protein